MDKGDETRSLRFGLIIESGAPSIGAPLACQIVGTHEVAVVYSHDLATQVMSNFFRALTLQRFPGVGLGGQSVNERPSRNSSLVIQICPTGQNSTGASAFELVPAGRLMTLEHQKPSLEGR